MAPVVLALFGITAVVVLVVSLIVWAVGLANADSSDNLTLPEVIWRAILTTIDTGAVGNYTGGPATAGFLIAMLGVTLVGIFLTSVLIGILVTGIQGRLEELRKGRSRVLEEGQTVILGWSQTIFTILSELVVANENQHRSVIVILADRSKVEMEDEIKARVGDTGRTRIVCRSGSPIDLSDLDLVNLDTSKSVIVLAPEIADPDVDIIKTILAITNNPHRRAEPYHIVAQLRDPASLEVATIVGRGEAQLVLSGDLIARIIAQTCRQSGLSVVYTELLDFEGDEIYAADPPAGLIGRSFGEALSWYEESTIIGILTGDSARLNPAMETPIAMGDRLLAISADDDTVRASAEPVGGVLDDLIEPARERTRSPERTLILGWNQRTASIIRNLDSYFTPGSQIVVMVDPTEPEPAFEPLRAELSNAALEGRRGDTTSRSGLASITAEGFDHVIVLCSDTLDPERADARTLITLIHLREMVAERGGQLSITSEMLKLRNRALADVTRADDFIVSDRLVSLLITQLSESAYLKRVFDDLFDPAGSEIFLRPAAEYVRTGQPMTFATIVESARRRGEVAIGYRRKADAADAERAYGVVVNPPKSVALTLEPADRVIVLAEGG